MVIPVAFAAFIVAIFLLNPILLWTAATISNLIRSVVDFRRLRSRVVSLLIAYVGVDLCFAALFQMLALHSQNAFRPAITTFLDAVYFSTMTLATVGYGDVVATNNITRVLTILEVFIGIALLVVLLSAAMSTPESESSCRLQRKRDPAA